jgi:type III pantothenate kinase
VILADVGNTHMHIYEEGRVLHLEPEDAIDAFGERILYYICVDPKAREKIMAETYWRDLEPRIDLPGSYEGMGVDRRALCLSRDEGLFVDAGSALTVDRVVGGRYEGGMILPGLHAYRRVLAEISPVLDREPDWNCDPGSLPKGTSEQLGYGIIAPIYHEILRLRKGLSLYITGGDGRIVASWFDDALYDETLVFQGMKKALAFPSPS